MGKMLSFLDKNILSMLMCSEMSFGISDSLCVVEVKVDVEKEIPMV